MIQPCLMMPLFDNLKIAKAVSKVFKKKDYQKFFFACREFHIRLPVSDYHIQGIAQAYLRQQRMKEESSDAVAIVEPKEVELEWVDQPAPQKKR